jgi:hypothetical protein
MAHRTGPRKYDPLTAYLAGLADDEVTLTLAEMQRIIGAPLPRWATTAAFWSNAREQATLPPWREAGWRVRRIHLRGDLPAVTFVRDSSDTDV